jgi:hypothetical protein
MTTVRIAQVAREVIYSKADNSLRFGLVNREAALAETDNAVRIATVRREATYSGIGGNPVQHALIWREAIISEALAGASAAIQFAGEFALGLSPTPALPDQSAAIEFAGQLKLGLAAKQTPGFICPKPVPKTWARATVVAKAWTCATIVPAEPCTDENDTEAFDVLATEDGSTLTTQAGYEIKV